MNIYTYFFLFLPNWGSRYGPPVRTKYRVIVENMSSRTSWQVCVRLESCGLNVMLKGLILTVFNVQPAMAIVNVMFERQ